MVARKLVYLAVLVKKGSTPLVVDNGSKSNLRQLFSIILYALGITERPP